jgi:hypothetical protein
MGSRLGEVACDLTGIPNSDRTVRRVEPMKWMINSLLGYWILLLIISLGAAAVVYEVWLKGRI